MSKRQHKRRQQTKLEQLKQLAGRRFSLLSGIAVGFVNGLFGAGGGLVAVPILRRGGLSEAETHASSVAVILPLSVFSFVLYLTSGRLEFSQGLPYLLPGLLGGLAGCFLLPRLSAKLLRKTFSLFLIYAGIRMCLK